MAERKIINTCEKYIQSVSYKYAISRAFMFGSFAKGTNREDSDIDIAIILKKIDNPFHIQFFSYTSVSSVENIIHQKLN